MTATVAPNPVAPTAAIERVLCDCVGSEVKIISTETLSDEDRRNLLVRCSIESNGRLPSSVVIKQARGDYDPEKLAHWDTLRLHRDWLGAQFLSAVSPAEHCPRFWAGDRELGFIILEDFGSTHSSLVEPLLEQDAASAERALVEFMTRLGQMHAQSKTKFGALAANARGS